MRLALVRPVLVSIALLGASSLYATQVQPAAATTARDVSLIDANRPVAMPPATPKGKAITARMQ